MRMSIPGNLIRGSEQVVGFSEWLRNLLSPFHLYLVAGIRLCQGESSSLRSGPRMVEEALDEAPGKTSANAPEKSAPERSDLVKSVKAR